ncbi:MAG: cell division protein FtsQ/DivIB [Candidatus Amoebophilus sp.]
MFKFYQWIKSLSLLVGVLLLFGCLIIVEKRYAKQRCKTIDIHIQNVGEQHFIDEKDIFSYLTEKYIYPLQDAPIQQIKITQIENIIKSHNFVRKCSVYKTWKGDIKINILPKRVLARIICPYGIDQYIDELGELVPLPKIYTARVLLLDSVELCNLENTIQSVPYSKSILKVLHLINKEPFWKAQITHISVNKKGELTLTTLFNRQKIYLGKPEDIEKKMKKLMLFYKVIIPCKGWNAYKRINLKFDNQIVCE